MLLISPVLSTSTPVPSRLFPWCRKGKMGLCRRWPCICPAPWHPQSPSTAARSIVAFRLWSRSPCSGWSRVCAFICFLSWPWGRLSCCWGCARASWTSVCSYSWAPWTSPLLSFRRSISSFGDYALPPPLYCTTPLAICSHEEAACSGSLVPSTPRTSFPK